MILIQPRVQLSRWVDAVIYIPRDRNRTGDVFARATRACRWLWSRGIYPGPAAVSTRMHGRGRRDLNDRETRARTATMARLRIPLQRRPKEGRS